MLNLELVICNMDFKVNFNFEIIIEKGRGYVFVEENKKVNVFLGIIFIDFIYIFIKNVKYSIENYCVE